MSETANWVPRKEAPDVARISLRHLARYINAGTVRIARRGQYVYCYGPDLDLLRKHRAPPTMALDGTPPASTE